MKLYTFKLSAFKSKLNKKLKKLKKEGGPQFLSLTFYLQVKWLVQPSLVFTPPQIFWITNTGFEELWTDPQMLYLWSRNQGGGPSL